MDVRRFAELFAAEAGEHLRLLNRGILGLESGDAAVALEQAFRAVHTIKGLAATMGYRRVTTQSHALEDRLSELRAHGGTPDAATVDALLQASDALDAAVAGALAGQDAEPAAGGTGAARSARVRLRSDAPLRGARALLVVRAAERAGVLAGHEPATFDAELEGDLVLRLVPGADEAAAETAIRAAGEVEQVTFEDETPADEPAAPDAGAHHVRVDRALLDDVAEGIGELAVLHARIGTASMNGAAPALDRMGSVLAELQRGVFSMRMVPLGDVFERLPRVVRDAARALGKDVDLRMEGGDVQVDRAIADELGDPLVHLVRNAVDHGLETPPERVRCGKSARGTLRLRVSRERAGVRLEVSDDGRGIPLERVVARARALGQLPEDPTDGLTTDEVLRLISAPGFSTAEQVTEVSGRGVGMDAVVNRVRAVGGAIALATEPGLGTTFTLRLPVTLAVAQALLVRIGGEDYAVPLTHVREAIELNGGMVVPSGGRESVRVRDELVPLIRLREVLRAGAVGEECAALIAEVGERRAALAVDELRGREQILVKTFDVPAGTLPVFSGATLLADGRPALILDPASVL